jgi:hypothetical protein
MTTPTTRRLVGACGVLTVVLSVLIGLVPPPPALGAPGSEVVAYYAAHGAPVLLWNWLGLVGLLPNLVVSAWTIALVKRREGADGWLWLVLLLATAMFDAAAFGVLADLQALAYVAPRLSPEVAGALSDVGAMWFGMMFLTSAAWTGAFAWAVLATRVWPAWIAWFALASTAASAVASVGCLVFAWPFAAAGPVTLGAFGLLMAWLLAYTVLIFVREPA